MTQNNVIDDPNAFVDGQTLTQWVEDYLRWTYQAPLLDSNGNFINTINDPQATVANSLNPQGSQMFFITGSPGYHSLSAATANARTFYVQPGQDVLAPVYVIPDSEGGNLSPSEPTGSPANRVETYLHDQLSALGPGTTTLDGTTYSLPQLDTGVFHAGVYRAGTVGYAEGGVNDTSAQQASLQTTGVAGYFAVLDNLSPGSHQLINSVVHNGTPTYHVDNIVVGALT